MLNFFKKSKKKNRPQLTDLDQNPLVVGDQVESLRYDLGLCEIIEKENGIFYRSLESGEEVSWLLMIDAATEFQKVRKVESMTKNNKKNP
ncbi:hypothetical protein ACFLU5_05815 [Bacteroidota bacterium]